MDFLQNYFYRVFELPLPRNAQKRTLKKVKEKYLGLVCSSKVNQIYVEVYYLFLGALVVAGAGATAFFGLVAGAECRCRCQEAGGQEPLTSEQKKTGQKATDRLRLPLPFLFVCGLWAIYICASRVGCGHDGASLGHQEPGAGCTAPSFAS
jgi:hypothetical protein